MINISILVFNHTKSTFSKGDSAISPAPLHQNVKLLGLITDCFLPFLTQITKLSRSFSQRLTDFVCSGRGAITGGGVASSSSSSSSETGGTAGVSDTVFTFYTQRRKATFIQDS